MPERFIIVLLILLLGIRSPGQSYPGISIGGLSDEKGVDFVVEGMGRYTLLASTRSVPSERDDIALFSVQRDFGSVWLKSYGNDRHEYPHSITTTPDGGYLIAGSKWDGGFGRLDIYLIKTDAFFNQEWETYLGGNHRDEGFSVTRCSDGYVVCGMSRSFEPQEYGDYYMAKVDHGGNLLWEYVSGDLDSKDYLFNVIEDVNGDLVAVGVESGHHDYSTFEFLKGHSKSVIFKLDSWGNPIWIKKHGGSGNCWYKQVVNAPDGGFYTIGSTQNGDHGSFDISLTRYNNSGDSLWSRSYGSYSFDYGNSLAVDADHNLYLVGTSCRDTINFSTDLMVVKTDSSGNVIWEKWFGGDQSDEGMKVRITQDGVAVVGHTKSFGNGGQDAWLIELDTNGNLKHWPALPSNAVVNIYPNPTNQAFNIVLNSQLPCDDFELQVLNVHGEIIKSFPLQKHSFTSLSVVDWPSGMYIYRLYGDCLPTNPSTGKLIVR